MNRNAATAFIALGLLAAGLGWAFLPPHRGRLQYVVEVVDPRPPSEAEMPDSLGEIEVSRLFAFVPRTVTLRSARLIRLTRSRPGRGPSEIAVLEHMSQYLGASDYELGSPPENGPHWAAGAASGLRRGSAELGTRTVEISAVLGRLGPLFDESLWTDAPEAFASELEQGGWQLQVSYLLFALSWREREQALAQLRAHPRLLAAPGWEALSPARPPPISDPVRLLIAAALVGAGLCVLVWQLRRMSWGEVARRLGRQ